MLRTVKTSLFCGIIALCASVFADDSKEDNSPIYPGYDMCQSSTVEVTTNSGDVIKGHKSH